MFFYVLGRKENPVLNKYIPLYKKKLQDQLEFLVANQIIHIPFLYDYIEKEIFIDFIYLPDIASLINLIYHMSVYKQNLQLHYKDYITQLEKELFLFHTGEVKKSITSQGNIIPGTHIRLTISDANPFNSTSTHPEHKKTGGMLGWGDLSETQWIEVYKKTFSILKKADSGMYDEINRMVKKIIPLGTAIGVHNSASHKDCIGHLYMGYTLGVEDHEINNLEAIIHESSHNKLNLIMQFDSLVLNTKEEIYYSPYRPDSRPIIGIYLGVHAIAPTVYVLIKSYKYGLLPINSEWFKKIVLYHIKNKIAVRVLEKYSLLSDLGKIIFQEIKSVISLTDRIIQTLEVSKNLLLDVQNIEKRHFLEVNHNYKNLKY